MKIHTNMKTHTNRYKPVGWRGESHRHYLAAKGIKTKHNYMARGKRAFVTVEDERYFSEKEHLSLKMLMDKVKHLKKENSEILRMQPSTFEHQTELDRKYAENKRKIEYYKKRAREISDNINPPENDAYMGNTDAMLEDTSYYDR